jgi:hypothetical protein
VNDFEARDVGDGAFEAGVLIAADDEGVKAIVVHGGANVFEAAVDFGLAWHSWPPTSGKFWRN